ncbi:MAG TPA: tetratricopeptide repeat protein [Kofleriaceae bacterium]|nr:tetratricopeptide repeat protein [Kofleriaceae bacterium]
MFRAQQYTGVASLCADALEGEPDNLDLRVLRVRALLALRRDEEARRELSRILRWHSETAEVFRLLGELAIRRSKLQAAETFLRQALKLSPADRKVEALLELVRSSNQPTVAVEKLPAATATVGCTLSLEDALSDEAIHEFDDAPRAPRFALGTDYQPSPMVRPADLFGHYLVDIGALTPLQLRAVLDYHRRAGVRVGAAAVALGFASEPDVEGAAHAFHLTRHNS